MYATFYFGFVLIPFLKFLIWHDDPHLQTVPQHGVRKHDGLFIIVASILFF
jgi:hypothetical protein